MKAVVMEHYGSTKGLVFRDLPKPLPQKEEILVRVKATTAHIGDTRIRRADPFLVRLVFGLVRPRKNLVLGIEVAGVVEEVGSRVTDFQPGDEVMALTGFSLGGYAEYVALPGVSSHGNLEKKGIVVHKPKNLSFEEAAAVPAGALTALKNLQKVRIKRGDEWLINGASGSLGTYALQLAEYYGTKTTAVCSEPNFALVRSLGARETVDYRSRDFTKLSKSFDLVYDAIMKTSKRCCRSILKKNGAFLDNNGLPPTEEKDLLFLKDLIEKGVLHPVIDRTFSLEDISAAHRYVDTGHKRGNVVILV